MKSRKVNVKVWALYGGIGGAVAAYQTRFAFTAQNWGAVIVSAVIGALLLALGAFVRNKLWG
jgi:uncharacterized membrane protein